MKIRKIIKEYCSIKEIIFEKEFGNKLKKIFEPSSGGIGTKLKIASERFITVIASSKNLNLKDKISGGANLRNKPKNKAIIKFASTPAEATAMVPRFFSLKLSGLKGTGFA